MRNMFPYIFSFCLSLSSSSSYRYIIGFVNSSSLSLMCLSSSALSWFRLSRLFYRSFLSLFSILKNWFWHFVTRSFLKFISLFSLSLNSLNKMVHSIT